MTILWIWLVLVWEGICVKLSGNYSLGYYFVHGHFGTPGQIQTLIVDTGSSLTLTVCKGCENCGEHSYPPFDPKASGTFVELEVNRTFAITYAEGSSYSGRLFSDVLKLEGQKSGNRGALGCVEKESGAVRVQPAEGILGLGVSALFAHTNMRPFAICLGHNGGEVSFAGWNQHLHSGLQRFINSTPKLFSRQYGVELRALSIAGRRIVLPPEPRESMTPFFDTGSTVVYFSRPVYQALADGLSRFCASAFRNCAGHKRFSPCLTSPKIASRSFLSTFPNINLHFNGTSLTWKPQDFFYRSEDDQYCVLWEEGEQTVLGAPLMRNLDVLFDAQNSRLGVADARCSGLELHGQFMPKSYPSWVRPRPSTVLASRNSPFWVDRLDFFSEH